MRYLDRNRIIYMTTLFLCSIVEPIPARQMLAQQLNRRKRKGRKARQGEARRGEVTRRDATWRPFSPSWMRLWLLHRREASLCGSPNESRQKEGQGRGNGQMFSSSPTCAIPLLFNTDATRWRPANSEREGKALLKFRQMPFPLGGICARVPTWCSISLSSWGLDYRYAPRITFRGRGRRSACHR